MTIVDSCIGDTYNNLIPQHFVLDKRIQSSYPCRLAVCNLRSLLTTSLAWRHHPAIRNFVPQPSQHQIARELLG